MDKVSRVLVAVMLLAACGGGDSQATDKPDRTDRATEEPAYTLPPHVGEIEFGLDFDPDTLDIIKPTTRFKTTYPEIAWSAHLSDTANAATLRWVLVSVSPGGAESILFDEDVSIANPDFAVLANKIDLASLVDNKAGTYAMRYLRDTDILAEGEFELVGS